jgi:hypothetical protein
MDENEWSNMEYTGIAPLPSFGHTATEITKTKIILFGGATGEPSKYIMTDSMYIFYIFKKAWAKLEGINNH